MVTSIIKGFSGRDILSTLENYICLRFISCNAEPESCVDWLGIPLLLQDNKSHNV